ncbi:MAG: GNAT family N-acetyltransferase [Candidatus Limnocylindrales bacterium]
MITIRQPVESDLPILYEQQSDPVAQKMAVFGGRDWDGFQEQWRTRILANPANVARVIVLEDGTVAGNVLCWPHDGRRYVGYWIGREFWGRGIGSEALRLLLADVTERPIYAWVALSNRGSVRVLEKNGFAALDPQPPPNQTDVPEQLMELR